MSGTLNPNVYTKFQEFKFKDCFGKGCKNKPTSILKVKYINKLGSFCSKCTAELTRLELGIIITTDDALNSEGFNKQ